MATSRDDMVFRPRLKADGGHYDRVMQKAKEERRLREARQKRGVVQLAVDAYKARATIRILRRLRAKRAQEDRLGGRPRRPGGSARKFMKAGLFSGIMGGMAVAAGIALRLATGATTERAGQILNRLILGENDDRARAAQGVRSNFINKQSLMLAVANNATQTQLQSVQQDLVQLATVRERGVSAIKEHEHLQVENLFDMIISRIIQIAKKVWRDLGLDELVNIIKTAIQIIKDAINTARNFVGMASNFISTYI